MVTYILFRYRLGYFLSIQSNQVGEQSNQVEEESNQVAWKSNQIQADLVTDYHLRFANKQVDTRRIPPQATKDTERSDK